MNDATQAILSGHNCCILGQPGTGKTRFLLDIAAKLRSEGKTVNITASTGIAAANIGGTTVHKFCGKFGEIMTDNYHRILHLN